MSSNGQGGGLSTPLIAAAVGVAACAAGYALGKQQAGTVAAGEGAEKPPAALQEAQEQQEPQEKVERNRPMSHLHNWDLKRTQSLKANFSASFSRKGPGDKKHLVYVPRVVLTGGPCGGKSSSMDHLKDALLERGWDVYFAPETATLMLNGGCEIPESSSLAATEFQFNLLSLQRQMEGSFVRVAAGADKPAVVIFDRGLLDSKAYLPEKWQNLLRMMNTTEEEVLKRYDAVVHLVTAADGAEQYYSGQQAEGFSGLRKENTTEAKVLDIKLQSAWRGHTNHFIVDNSTDFEGKMARATAEVIKVIKALEDSPAPTKK